MEMNQGLRRAALLRGRGSASGGVQGGGAGATAGSPKKPCYFFNHGQCKNSDANCKFAHVLVSPEEKAKMEKPERRSPSVARGGKREPQATSTTSPAAPPASTAPRYCMKFIKGNCTNGDTCSFAHLGPEAVAEMKRAGEAAKAKAKAKAKAQPKAAAKAMGLIVPVKEK